MECIVCTMPDGRAYREDLNPKVLDLMMGKGFGWDKAKRTYEAAKFAVPIGPYTKAMAQEWVLAIGKGGLTRTQALDLFRRKLLVRHGKKVRGERLGISRRDLTNGVIKEYAALPLELQREATKEDRYFRNAIDWDGVTCACNMDKARVIHMIHIRRVRNKELHRIDNTPEYRAAERKLIRGDLTDWETFEAIKQPLRDIPQTFDLEAYTTPETLKAAWPAELPARVA